MNAIKPNNYTYDDAPSAMSSASFHSMSPTATPTYGVLETLEELTIALDEWIQVREAQSDIENNYMEIPEWGVSRVPSFDHLFKANQNSDNSNWKVETGVSLESMFEGGETVFVCNRFKRDVLWCNTL